MGLLLQEVQHIMWFSWLLLPVKYKNSKSPGVKRPHRSYSLNMFYLLLCCLSFSRFYSGTLKCRIWLVLKWGKSFSSETCCPCQTQWKIILKLSWIMFSDRCRRVFSKFPNSQDKTKSCCQKHVFFTVGICHYIAYCVNVHISSSFLASKKCL